MIDSIVYSVLSFLYYLFYRLEVFASSKVIDLDQRCTKYEMRKWRDFEDE